MVKGLKEYTGATVVRTNQTGKKPDYPFLSYTITTLASENNGSWGTYPDGLDRQQVQQIWSISALSDDAADSMTLAVAAREWLEHTGRTVLKDSGITVKSTGAITNRDNIISIEYEYKNGFDVVFYLFDTAATPIAKTGYIETAVTKLQEE